MEEKLMQFLLELNEKGFINNYDFDYEKQVKAFVNKTLKEQGN